MKNKKRPLNDLQYVAAGKKRYPYYFSFAKKDALIRNIEIIVACVIAFIAGMSLYRLF